MERTLCDLIWVGSSGVPREGWYALSELEVGGGVYLGLRLLRRLHPRLSDIAPLALCRGADALHPTPGYWIPRRWRFAAEVGQPRERRLWCGQWVGASRVSLGGFTAGEDAGAPGEGAVRFVLGGGS